MACISLLALTYLDYVCPPPVNRPVVVFCFFCMLLVETVRVSSTEARHARQLCVRE